MNILRRLLSWTAAVLVVALPWVAVADAQVSGRFTLTAAADVVTIEYYESRTPAVGAQEALLVASPSSAQATLDSLGTSMAFASAPYPGPIVVSLPGTVAGVTGGDVTLPEYPLYVSSSHPTTESAEVDEGAYRLRASSTATESTGVAATGIASDAGSASGTRIAASTRNQDDQLVAHATTQAGLIAVDPLRVSDLRSRAVITQEAGGEPEVTTEFLVSGLTIGGQGLEVRDGELVLAGTGLPLETSPLSDALTEAGLDIQVLDPEVGTTENGSIFAVSGGLRLRRTVDAPDGGSSTFVHTFGRSAVTLASTAFAPSTPEEGDPDPTITAPPPSETAERPTDQIGGQDVPPTHTGRSTAPADLPVTTSRPSTAPAPIVDDAVEEPVVAAPSTEGEAVMPRPLALGAAPGELDGGGWYLMIVAGAVSALVASRVLGALGIKLGLGSEET